MIVSRRSAASNLLETHMYVAESKVPFLILQAVGLALIIIFPELILWLPRQVYG